MPHALRQPVTAPRPGELPWWTWIAPALVCHIGTWLSVGFAVHTGVSLWYLPLPLGMVMVHWWGPRALAGMYVNAAASAGLWGLPWHAGPVVGAPEVLTAWLSWLWMQQVAQRRAWPGDLPTLLHLLVGGILLPITVGVALHQAVLVRLDVVNWDELAWAAGSMWLANVYAAVAVVVPLLALVSGRMHAAGLVEGRQIPPATPLLPVERCNPAWVMLLVVCFALPALIEGVSPPRYQWLGHGIFTLVVAVIYGFGMSTLAGAWAALLVLVMPWILRGAAEASWTPWEHHLPVGLDLLLISVAGLVVARSQDDLRAQVARRESVEQVLRRRESQLQLMVRNSPTALAMFDRDLRCMAWSARWQLALGLQGIDLRGRSPSAMFPGLTDRWRQSQRRCLAGSVEVGVEEQAVIAGQPQWIRWQMHPWLEDSGQVGGIVAFLELVTDRRNAEEALRQIRRRDQVIGELASDFACSVTIDAGGRRQVQWSTEAVHRITGYSAEELMKRCDGAGWVHPDDLAEYRRHQQRLLSGQPGSAEYRVIRPDGRVCWLADHSRPIADAGGGRVTRIIGVCQDITTRKAGEAALREAERRSREIALTIPAPVAITRAGDGEILFANRDLAELLGTTMEAMLGRRSTEFYQDRTQRTMLTLLLEQKGSVRQCPVTLRRADGVAFPASLSIEPVTFRGLPAWFCVILDRTQSLRQTEDLAALHVQLDMLRKQLQRIASRHPEDAIHIVAQTVDLTRNSAARTEQRSDSNEK